MPLQTVTITGLDETTNLDRVVELTKRFPFVEWGVLMSLNSGGHHPRYPYLNFLQENIGQLPIPVSVHLCGSLANDAIMGWQKPFDTVLYLMENVKRFQVNMGGRLRDYPGCYENLSRLMDAYVGKYQVIIQTPSFDLEAVKAASHRDGGPVFLQDASGGKGLSAYFRKPTWEGLVGFAGGIMPENVVAVLAQIIGMRLPNPYWIDMESGVRDEDDRLDLDKVETILNLCQNYILPDAPGVAGL